MTSDVFYYGDKPNVHPKEQKANNLEHAKSLATTEHFWIINEFCDYTNFNFDFDFETLRDEDIWAIDHINIWPSQHQKDSGTWLVANKDITKQYKIYRNDVDPVIRKISNDNWKLFEDIDTNKFDFSWHPDPTEPPFIYRWGCKYYPVEIQHVLEYVVENASQVKYMDTVVELLPNKYMVQLQEVDDTKYDLSFRPDPREPPFIYTWGNKYIPATIKPTLEYHTPGSSQRKYMTDDVPVKPEWDRWFFLKDIDLDSFDFSWRPDPREPKFIYIFGNTQYSAEKMPTIQYIVDDATVKKYVSNIVVKLKPKPDLFEHFEKVIDFDYSWTPDPYDPPFIYAWGNQYNKPTEKISVQYKVKGATNYKYMEESAVKAPCKDNFIICHPIEENSFDFSWEPSQHEPPFIFVFGNQWYPAEVMPTVKYVHKNGTEYKYVHTQIAKLKQRPERFENTRLIKKFDYSWVPNPNDPPYIYQFGTQWAKTDGPRYVVENAIEIKYIDQIVSEILPSGENWEIPNGIKVDNFDFSWHPDSTSPPYIYQFGTVTDENDGPRYITPDNNGTVIKLLRKEINNTEIPKYFITTTLDDLIIEHENELFWAIRNNLNYDNFDFTWRPDISIAHHINAFGSQESELTCTYLVNGKMIAKGHRQIHFVEQNVKLDNDSLVKIFKKPDMFFVDKGNGLSQQRYKELKTRFPDIQKTRFLNTWVDTINRCVNKSSTELCWILSSELDYTEFDFNYYPNPWQMTMVNVFGTQWNHWGKTFLVNCEKFPEDTKYIKIVEHLPNINHVKNHRAVAKDCLHDIIVIDFLNGNIDDFVKFLNVKTNNKVTKVLTYNTDLYTTLTEYIQSANEDHFVWIVSSISDYSNFDFSYIIDPFSTDQLHSFAVGNQKYGDTLFVNLKLLKGIYDLKDFNKINFIEFIKTARLDCPKVIVEDDTHINFRTYAFDFPYINFVTSDNCDMNVETDEPMSIWSVDSKTIIINSEGATNCIIPKEALDVVKNELYDYPYIVTSKNIAKSRPLDIIFLSNGEKIAEENYEHLLVCTKGYENKIVRVDGVNGRVKAYHAAAIASNTPWLFTVFAKLQVNNKFDWNWQPDRLQKPKHYIFHATNPLNQLIYGHQAMIAYNKKLVLNNIGEGLDFTLDSDHEVCRINSGIAMYNTDEFSTWRTAFREAIKLCSSEIPVDKLRLDVWCEKGEGDFAEYSLKGANDGVEFYKNVNGEFHMLKLSYDWPWLKTFFNGKYSN